MSKLAITILIAVTVCVRPAPAAVTIDVVPSFGPDRESPSFNGFANNAFAELRAPGSSGVSRFVDPTGYLAVPSQLIPYREAFSSHFVRELSFHSWRGKADPTPGWDDGVGAPDAFSGEFGSSIYFGARILTDTPATEDIRLSDVSGEIHWEQDDGLGGFVDSTVLTLSLDFTTPSYLSGSFLGVDYGADGAPGGSGENADIVYDKFNPGPSDSPVDVIYVIGLADSIWVSPFEEDNSSQQNLDQVIRLLDVEPNQLLTASYTWSSTNDLGNVVTVTEGADVLFGYLTGDYNANGRVEQADLDLVLGNWGDAWPPEVGRWLNDQPTDGTIDQDDLDRVLIHWGDSNTIGGISASVVPEPASALLLLVGLGVVFLRNRPVATSVSKL